FANWLAHAQEKDPQYLKPAVRATFQIEKRSWTVYLYSVNPVGRSAARELTPRVLAEWLVGTRDAKILLSGWPWPAIRATERREYRALVVLLAGGGCKTDAGTPPSSPPDRVWWYLHQLSARTSGARPGGSAR